MNMDLLKIAIDNMSIFLSECEVELRVMEIHPDETKDDYFVFTLTDKNKLFETNVSMPGLPVEELKRDDVSFIEIPKIYVDGLAWKWDKALVTKNHIRSFYKNMMNDSEQLSNQVRKVYLSCFN